MPGRRGWRPDPEPIASPATGHQLLRSAEAVIAASGEASRDYERQVEEEIERHRAAELARAEAQSRALLSDAMERNDRYAQSLRRRLEELGGERERLVTELREQTDSVARHADEAAITRARLYRVIGQLGSFDADRSPTPTADGSGNGGRANGDESGTEAPAGQASPRPEPGLGTDRCRRRRRRRTGAHRQPGRPVAGALGGRAAPALRGASAELGRDVSATPWRRSPTAPSGGRPAWPSRPRHPGTLGPDGAHSSSGWVSS